VLPRVELLGEGSAEEEPSVGRGEIILIDGAEEDWFELAMNRTASGDHGG
jgi:hypothetical protein